MVLTGEAQQQKIILETPNYKGLVYLTYYYGKNLNIEDSAMLDAKGNVVFTKKTGFTPGIYSVVFPGKTKLMDVLVDKDPEMQIKADTSDLVNKTRITGSPDNLLFLQYQKFVAKKGKELQEVQLAYSKADTKKDSAQLESTYNLLNKELISFRDSMIKKNPASMLAAIFKGMREPEILNTKPVTSKDSLENYNYYKKHYWDGVSFMDDRVIRTPFFLPKA